MISEKFYERMKKLLGKEYDGFAAALEQPPVRAVRVNEIKISTEDFKTATELRLCPVEYSEDGFIPESTEGIGTGAEHHAGLFYVQDPGAMATVNALDVKKGWWVLDCCAAPGGKSSQLAGKIGESGFLLSNEYVPKRAKILVGNLERLGVTNALVTSLDTEELGRMFDGAFDLVLCDAPCSGEGMLRKYAEASVEWSEENVFSCAKRQDEILRNVAHLVKPGGYLLYSTCTYSIEENEGAVARFLDEHDDFSILPVKERLAAITADGVVPSGVKREDLRLTRRFYPHLAKGEGQYIALMQRAENIQNMQTILYKERINLPSKEEMRTVEKFISDNFASPIKARFIKQGDYVAAVLHDCPIPPHSVFMPGVVLGEVKKGVFYPHHQMFSALGKRMKRQENLKKGDPRVSKYLRGEEIEAREVTDGGWCTVCYEGAPLGGGKVSSGRVKNHYPKGLRNK